MVFYTYMWLREDGTPYYVGKGKGDRAFVQHNHSVPCPKDSSHILFQEHPSEVDAFAAEILFIAYYGRKDVGTGCLRNRTNGGEGTAGKVYSAEYRRKLSESGHGKASDETRRKNSERQRGSKNHNFGKKQPAEVNRKRADSNRGREKSAEERRNISASLMGHAPTRTGPHSTATRLKLRVAALARWARIRAERGATC
jgi:NUMOD3 motif